MDYKSLFIEKGYTPLEDIPDTKTKVECIDKDGYKYYATYDVLRDKRTKHLDKWKKQNPFKPYNMRLYASRMQENCCIVSTDEELRNASHQKIKFICPKCGKEYEKSWDHWTTQPKNCHYCQDCAHKESSYEFLVSAWLDEHNLSYDREYWFEDCRDVRVLPFDFIVWQKDKFVLIEADGCQHYYNSPMFNNVTLEERQRKDNIKTDYCKKHGYTLLRLPFWDFNRDTYKTKLNKTFFG